MRFKFKIQKYQTDAVDSVVNVFEGQPFVDNLAYRLDSGKNIDYETEAYKNADIILDDVALLKNIKTIQSNNSIKQSSALFNALGKCQLDVEMETGTGKTYVYIKTMFELNKKYGWSKYIIVVPSVAIREGVYKSFQMLETHFYEQYGKKIRFNIYTSKNLGLIDTFSTDGGINVLIINSQAFATSMKENGRSKESKIMYSKRDEFASRRPIDVLSANKPIVILDEPQRLEGAATQTGIAKFNPLFTINFSATHRVTHNLVYALDALDAYNQKLVKKIQVKTVEVENLRGTSAYMYLDDIVLSRNNPPRAKIEIQTKLTSGTITTATKLFDVKDNLEVESGLKVYEGYVVSNIDAIKGQVEFLNGCILRKGEVQGDVNEKIIQQLQIRETIKTHIKKECDLFAKGIKCLSLFFIDEVANYKSYNENGDEVHEYLWKIFEEEYNSIIKNELSLLHPEYQEYLKKYKVKDVHKGYFSIDRKGHAINSVENESSEDNISAYDLILKNKERLLSFDEPTRFIFSHSALREGWDNPNVFQICTLRHANSVIARRQEIGRGLRLCVDENGNRMDIEVLDENIHNVNTLTVIANENYADFVRGFQTEVRNSLRERPLVASIEYFKDKIVVDNNGNDQIITTQTAALINAYLVNNDYVDANNNITSKYREDVANNQLADMGKKLEPIKESIINLIQSIYDDSVLDDMVENGNKIKPINKLNDNFNKEEFQALWKKINHKYVYIVDYTSEELIKNAVASINANLVINKLRYVTNIATQVGLDEFKQEKTQRKEENNVSVSNVRYDLVGEIARGTNLTRRTVVKILSQTKGKLKMFEYNPEAYIKNVIRLIKEQKATMIVEHIGYSLVDQKYESSIFTEEKHKDFTSALKVDKHITDYVFTDGLVENSVEKRFADDLEKAEEVCVYAKLPKAFHIPTPVGNYSPDWAIAFNKGTVKHIFFIAETKGSMDSMQLKNIEKAKIDCAAKLFNEISNEGVKYHHVASYSDLLDCMTQM